MLTGSLRLGKIAGIAVNLHWSVAIVAVFLASGLAPALGWTAAAIGVVAFLASILAHELAHALVARRFQVGTESIDLWVVGGMARLDREAPSPRAEGWIAASGPLASLAVGVASIGGWLALSAADLAPTAASLLGWLGIVNVALAIFNLMPGAPLDGGRIVRAVRWQQHGDRHRAAREAGTAGTYLGWLLVGVGIWLVLNGRPGSWTLMLIGGFIVVNAKAEILASRVAQRLEGVKVRDLTWFGLAAAGTDMDADSMLWQRQRLGQAGAVVVQDDAGRPDGLVLEDQLWAVPAEQRPWVMLTQLMVPLARLPQADPDDDLASVLPRIDPRRPVVTVWHDGRLLGVVPPARLRERLTAASRF